MTPVLDTTPAAILRATGLLRSFLAHNDTHVNAIMQATLEDPDDQALMHTFAALVDIAAMAVGTLTNAGMSGSIDTTLTVIQQQLIFGDATRPDPNP